MSFSKFMQKSFCAQSCISARMLVRSCSAPTFIASPSLLPFLQQQRWEKKRWQDAKGWRHECKWEWTDVKRRSSRVDGERDEYASVSYILWKIKEKLSIWWERAPGGLGGPEFGWRPRCPPTSNCLPLHSSFFPSLCLPWWPSPFNLD